MSYQWIMVLVYTIFIPAILGLIRIRRINVAHYPFILLLWVGAINEVISYYTAKYLRNTAPNNNVYALVEMIIILWQYKRWNAFGSHKKIFPVLLISLAALWVMENFFINNFFTYNSYFTVITAASIVITGIAMINKILTTERKGLSKNPIFIICTCFILFYAYNATEELLWKFGITLSPEMSGYIYSLLIYVNLLVYIFYSYAILCMRRKSPFTMPS